MKVNLVNGLIKMIAEVEKLPSNTRFAMDHYDHCVIGQTVGWSSGYTNTEKCSKTLRRLFGIKKYGFGLFDQKSGTKYTERTWKVIRLFTTEIGCRVGRDMWLMLAKRTLSELQSA